MEPRAILKGHILVNVDNETEYIEKITRVNSGLNFMICCQPEDAILFQHEKEAMTWAAIINLSNKERGFPDARFKAVKLFTVFQDCEEVKEND